MRRAFKIIDDHIVSWGNRWQAYATIVGAAVAACLFLNRFNPFMTWGWPEAILGGVAVVLVLTLVVSAALAAWRFFHPLAIPNAGRPVVPAALPLISDAEIALTLKQFNTDILALTKRATSAEAELVRLKDEDMAKLAAHLDRVDQAERDTGEKLEFQVRAQIEALKQRDEVIATLRADYIGTTEAMADGFEHLRRAVVAARDMQHVEQLLKRLHTMGAEMLSPARMDAPDGGPISPYWERDFESEWCHLFSELSAVLEPYGNNLAQDMATARFSGELTPYDIGKIGDHGRAASYIKQIRGMQAKIEEMEWRSPPLMTGRSEMLSDTEFWTYRPKPL